MNHEAPHYDEHPERTQNEWQTLMANGVVDTDFKPTKEYLTSEQGQREIEAENKAHDQIEMVDRLIANAKEQAENGRYSNVEFERLKNKFEAKKEAYQKEADKQSEAARQDFSETFIDRYSVGTPEEDWVDSSQVFHRDEVLSQTADQPAKAATLASEQEITNLKDQEVLSAEEAERHEFESEKTGTYLEDEENISRSEAEANLENHQEAISQFETSIPKSEKTGTYLEDEENISRSEAEANLAKSQEMLSRTETPQNKDESKNHTEQLEALEDQLDELRSNLAELFVKKNRIIGPKHREEYEAAKEEYEATLNKYLRLKSELTHGSEAEFVKDYIQQDQLLLKEVENKVDNGNLYRKITSRILGNEYYKKALLAHGVRSLGVSGAPNITNITTNTGPKLAASESAPEPESESESAPEPESESESAPEPESESESVAQLEPESTPQSEPESKSEPEPKSESEPESEPEPTPPQSETDSESQEQLAADQDFEATVRALINPNIFDEEDIQMVLMKSDPAGSAEQNATYDRIQEWWDRLSDMQKNSIRTLMRAVYRSSNSGSALYYYLQTTGELASNNAN